MNLQTTCIGKDSTNSKHGIVNYHQGIYLDVFPLDNMPNCLEERIQWNQRIQKIARTAWDLRMFTHRGLLKNRKDLEWLSFWLNLTGRPNHLFEKYIEMVSYYSKTVTEWSCTYSFWCRDQRLRFEYRNSDFEDVEYMPFEMLSIPVPSGYDSILTKSYGDWRQPVKGLNCHELQNNGFFDDTDNPYTFYVDETTDIKKDMLIQAIYAKEKTETINRNSFL